MGDGLSSSRILLATTNGRSGIVPRIRQESPIAAGDTSQRDGGPGALVRALHSPILQNTLPRPKLARRPAHAACRPNWPISEEKIIMGIVELILLIVLVLLVLGALPAWPHSRSWGYYPSGGLATVLIILLVLVLLF